MKLLSRYVKKNAFFAILLAVMGLWLLQVVFVYLDELGKLSDTYTNADVLAYLFYRSPHFLQLFMPTGALLGAVIGLGLLANHSELVVMRASGVSIYRIVSWVLQPAVLFVIVSLSINQFVLPYTNEKARQVNHHDTVENQVIAIHGYWTVQSLPDNFDNHGKEVVYIGYADNQGNIEQVKRWQIDDNTNLVKVSQAQKGHYVGQKQQNGQILYQWQLNDLTQLSIGHLQNALQRYHRHEILDLPIKPELVYLLTKRPNDLSLTELWTYQKLMSQQGSRSLEHELSFWQKLLSPFSVLSLVIVACSFVFGSLRTHSLGLRIVVAVLFGLSFSYLQDLVGFIALAIHFSPAIMVLLPIVFSTILGIYLLKKQQ